MLLIQSEGEEAVFGAIVNIVWWFSPVVDLRNQDKLHDTLENIESWIEENGDPAINTIKRITNERSNDKVPLSIEDSQNWIGHNNAEDSSHEFSIEEANEEPSCEHWKVGHLRSAPETRKAPSFSSKFFPEDIADQGKDSRVESVPAHGLGVILFANEVSNLFLGLCARVATVYCVTHLINQSINLNL